MYLFDQTYNKLIIPTNKYSRGSFLSNYASIACGDHEMVPAARTSKVSPCQLPFRVFVVTRRRSCNHVVVLAVTSNQVSQTSLKSNYFFSKFIFILKKKLSFFKKDFSKMLCLLLLGFFTGNIFGSFLNTIRQFFIWDGFITFFLITFMELISYLTYTIKLEPCNVYTYNESASQSLLRKHKNSTSTLKQSNICHIWLKFANLFKIGLLIGFFVDAFKVGS